MSRKFVNKIYLYLELSSINTNNIFIIINSQSKRSQNHFENKPCFEMPWETTKSTRSKKKFFTVRKTEVS